jgi:hypothetical protein
MKGVFALSYSDAIADAELQLIHLLIAPAQRVSFCCRVFVCPNPRINSFHPEIDSISIPGAGSLPGKLLAIEPGYLQLPNLPLLVVYFSTISDLGLESTGDVYGPHKSIYCVGMKDRVYIG